MSPADLADYADKTQNHNNITNCLSLRNNAALLHSSAWSALSAGEYSHKSTQSICTKKPQCLPQISLITQTKPKTTTTSQTVFLCEIMQLCCIPLRDLRYLRENIHIRVLNLSAQRNPNVSRRSRWLRRQNPKPQQHHKLSFSAK